MRLVGKFAVRTMRATLRAAGRVRAILPALGRSERFYRRPLAEIVGGADAQPDAQPPGPTE